ncbi:MAG: GTP cyclohydrolase MptA [Methermicoccaceae archaeon]
MSDFKYLPDVQAGHPDVPINLTRVGVTNVKKLVEVAREGKRPIVLISEFDIFVDLPSERKGANLSRNFEAINEVLEEAVASPVYEIESLCEIVAQRLLDRHEYATQAEVRMRSDYVVWRTAPVTETKCQDMVEIFAEAVAFRDESIPNTRMVGAELLGMTVCPCAQGIMSERAMEEMHAVGIEDDKIQAFIEHMPMPSHNQRGRGRIAIQVKGPYKFSLTDIISIIEDSMSARIYEVLKRDDEAVVVYNAHKRAMFVEDCVRTMAQKIVGTFSNLPDDAMVTIAQVNEESIHHHNAFAERVATIGELRAEIYHHQSPSSK